MLGQCRLALISASRAHRPDLHRLVNAAAGQLAILAPCNRRHPVIVRSQHTNQQKQRNKKTCKKKCTRSSGRSAGTRKRTYLYLLNLNHFRSYICPINPPCRVASFTSTQTHNRSKIFPGILHVKEKNLTPLSGRSLSTGTNKKKSTKINRNLPFPVPPQRRLANRTFCIS